MAAQDIPAKLTLCRFLVAVTAILDVPRAYLLDSATHCRSLQLRYNLLGRRVVVRSSNPEVKSEGTITDGWGEGSISDDEGGDEASPNRRARGLVRVPVNSFRSAVRRLPKNMA